MSGATTFPACWSPFSPPARVGDFDDAHAICESLLWLNPNDNQGVRDIIDVIGRTLDRRPSDSRD